MSFFAMCARESTLRSNSGGVGRGRLELALCLRMLRGATGGGSRARPLPLSLAWLSGGTTTHDPLDASKAICARDSDADRERFVVRIPRGPTFGLCGSGRCEGWYADGGLVAGVLPVIHPPLMLLLLVPFVLPLAMLLLLLLLLLCAFGGGGSGRIPISTRNDGRRDVVVLMAKKGALYLATPIILGSTTFSRSHI